MRLAEEATELAHAATKALRYGADAYHPDAADSNGERVFQELWDVEAVCERLLPCLREKVYGKIIHQFAFHERLSMEIAPLLKRGDGRQS